MLTPNIFITVLLFTPLIYHDEKRATKLSVCLAVTRVYTVCLAVT